MQFDFILNGANFPFFNTENFVMSFLSTSLDVPKLFLESQTLEIEFISQKRLLVFIKFKEDINSSHAF